MDAIADDRNCVKQCLGAGARLEDDHLPLRVDAHQLQLQPAPIDHILDAEIKLAAHDDRVRLARELVEEVEADRVDLIVDVEA